MKFSTVVRRVEYHKDTDDFTVVTENLQENVEETERFTHVVVASGKFTIPDTPLIPGIEMFRGRILHSKDVKHVEEFKGQRVLIIGAAWSGEDLSITLMKFGAKSVIISWKDKPLGHKWPEGIEERPLVMKLKGRIAHFKDETTAEVDVVMFCTGYRLKFWFLSGELRLKATMLYYPENLYKGILWMKGGNNKLMYLGAQYNVYCFDLFDAQAIWACSNIMGTRQLPNREEILAEIADWTLKVKEATKDNDMDKIFRFMMTYFKHIVETVGYRKDVLEAEKLLERMMEDRANNICTWRDKQFKCIYTGKLTPAPKIPWMDNFDDSLETFLNQD